VGPVPGRHWFTKNVLFENYQHIILLFVKCFIEVKQNERSFWLDALGLRGDCFIMKQQQLLHMRCKERRAYHGLPDAARHRTEEAHAQQERHDTL